MWTELGSEGSEMEPGAVMVMSAKGLGAWLGAPQRGCQGGCSGTESVPVCKPSQHSCSILLGSIQQPHPQLRVILSRENPPGGAA